MNDQGEAGDPLVGGTCHYLNECADGNDDCGVFTDYTNTDGSLTYACIAGYEWIDDNDHFSVAKISTNAILVNQVIFAEVLPNASTMTVDTTVNAKALVPSKLLTRSTKLYHVKISMNVDKMSLSVTIMQIAKTFLDNTIVTVTLASKLIQLVNT